MTLYLKYRPQDFKTLVWQEFIKNTLTQAIKNNKLVWAYLFCWPRWTWKTSTARIFAKAINCLNPSDWNPCLDCEICRWFQEDSLVDIIEIDAASYTWVDNVREIIERAKFLPTKCKYKVYIIDEVHMLSKWAFNALLKILEEPPSHLKFILATTEIHKIPETILSRCQRYDFKSITPDDLKNRILYIAQNENIKIDDESIEFIVKESSWWLRNAISLFEQLIENSQINYENVIKNYWIPKKENIVNFYNKLLSKDVSLVEDFEYISKNFNLNLFFKELLFYIKDELLANLNSNNFKDILFIFETLEESFWKIKVSFDTKTTLLVWVLKSLKWNEFFENSLPQKESFNLPKSFSSTSSVRPQTEQKQITPKVEIKKEEIIVEENVLQSLKEEHLSEDDLFDVFGSEEENLDVWNIEIPKVEVKKEQEPKKSKIFPKEDFINNLKNIWAKWALTMSLRAADLNFDWNILKIFAKTKIAHNQISDADSISKMNQSLEWLWFNWVDIEVL